MLSCLILIQIASIASTVYFLSIVCSFILSICLLLRSFFSIPNFSYFLSRMSHLICCLLGLFGNLFVRFSRTTSKKSVVKWYTWMILQRFLVLPGRLLTRHYSNRYTWVIQVLVASQVCLMCEYSMSCCKCQKQRRLYG